jgi:hypothetical protein
MGVVPTLLAAACNPPATFWAIALFLAKCLAADDIPGIAIFISLKYLN